jgi:iron-sulfur cluster assembly accessory protein
MVVLNLSSVPDFPISDVEWVRQPACGLSPSATRRLTVNLPPKVTSRAFERLAEIGAGAQGKALRVAVDGGGCSGFQYSIDLDEPKADDLVLEGAGERVLVDPVSLPFLAGATITFSEELIGARFVIDNPNATSSCGCGTSFSI